MRKLNTSDVFAMTRIIKASGMREDLKQLVSKISAMDDKDIESIGMDGAFTIIESLSERSAEKAIYEFLSGPLEMDPDEVRCMELMELTQTLEKLYAENDLKTFFAYVSGILGKN